MGGKYTKKYTQNKSSEQIERSIIDLVTSIKNEKHDNHKYDKKVEEKRCEVNNFLWKLLKEKN